MVSQVLYDAALVVLRFRHLSHHFLKLGGFVDIFVSKTRHSVYSAGLLNS